MSSSYARRLEEENRRYRPSTSPVRRSNYEHSRNDAHFNDTDYHMTQLKREMLDVEDRLHARESRIAELETENRSVTARLNDVEERAKRHTDDYQMNSDQMQRLERDYEELKRSVAMALPSDGSYFDSRSHEGLIRRVKEHMEEHGGMRSKISRLETNLGAAEEETKRNQDTVRRLLEDNERTRRFMDNADQVKEERDSAIRQQDRQHEELRRMEERLGQTRETQDKLTRDIRDKQLKTGELEAEIRERDLVNHAAAQEFRAFKDSISALLSVDGVATLYGTGEEAIRERIRQLAQNEQTVRNQGRSVEEKIRQLSTQLEEQAQLHKQAVGRARKAEEMSDNAQHQLRAVHGELQVADSRHGDKDKYVRLLEQLASTMRMESLVRKLGVDVNGETLLARAQQLVKIEEETYGKKDGRMHTMQEHLRDAKRELETKDAHLDLLRKKLLSSETEQTLQVESDWEAMSDKHRKVTKQYDKLTKQYDEAKTAIHALKGESVENKQLRMANEELTRDLRELERKAGELEQAKNSASKRITELKSEKRHNETEAERDLRMTETTLHGLTAEVHRLKSTNTDMVKREKQLHDLRHVIARMLGLNAESLAVADYEIIARLEKLVEGQHFNLISNAPVRRPATMGGSSRPMSGGRPAMARKTASSTKGAWR